MTALEWAVAGYALCGLIGAAVVWHDCVDQEFADMLFDEIPVPARLQPAVFYTVLTMLLLVVFATWPVELGIEARRRWARHTR